MYVTQITNYYHWHKIWMHNLFRVSSDLALHISGTHLSQYI